MAIAFIPELVSQILVETSDSVEWPFDLILLQQNGRGQTVTTLRPTVGIRCIMKMTVFVKI